MQPLPYLASPFFHECKPPPPLTPPPTSLRKLNACNPRPFSPQAIVLLSVMVPMLDDLGMTPPAAGAARGTHTVLGYPYNLARWGRAGGGGCRYQPKLNQAQCNKARRRAGGGEGKRACVYLCMGQRAPHRAAARPGPCRASLASRHLPIFLSRTTPMHLCISEEPAILRLLRTSSKQTNTQRVSDRDFRAAGHPGVALHFSGHRRHKQPHLQHRGTLQNGESLYVMGCVQRYASLLNCNPSSGLVWVCGWGLRAFVLYTAAASMSRFMLVPCLWRDGPLAHGSLPHLQCFGSLPS